MSEFRTKNLGLAGFLQHIGLTHLRTEPIGSVSVIFIFDDSLNECERIERDYYGGAACEDAQRFVEALRTVKQTIATAKESGIWNNPDQ